MRTHFLRVILLVGLLVGGALPLAGHDALAQDGGTEAVVLHTTDNLRLRAAPSTASRIYDVAPLGTPITAEAISPNYRWIRTTFHGQGGWMARRYLVLDSGDVATLPVSSEYVPPAVVSVTQYLPLNEVVVTAINDVNIRYEPTADADTIEELLDPSEAVITIMPAGGQASARAITADGLWVFVEYNTYRGWVKGQFLDVIGGTLDDLRRLPGVTYDAEGIFFGADSTTVQPGQCTNLRWSVLGPGSVHYKAQTVYGHGSRRECPLQTQQYKLIIVRPGNQIIERTVTVAVVTAEVEFTAASTTVARGTCTTLTWTTQAISEAFLDGESVEVNGSREVCPTEDTTTYLLRTLTLDNNIIDSEVTLTLVDATPTASVLNINYYADRLFITAGECVTVFWNVSGASQVFYQTNPVTGVGSQQECPAATTTYVLRVFTLDNRTIEQTLVVTVN